MTLKTDDVSSTVQFLSAEELAKRSGGDPSKVQDAVRTVLARYVGDADALEVMAAEKAFLAWIRSDPKNAWALIHDPVRAIANSGLPFPPRVLAQLKAATEQAPIGGPTKDFLEFLKSFRVTGQDVR